MMKGGGACGIHADCFAAEVAAATDDPTYGFPEKEPRYDDAFHFPMGHGGGLNADGTLWRVPPELFMKQSRRI